MKCARHPNVETYVRCGKCETPVCPDCSVMGPAGIRCRDCASLRSSPLYQVPPGLMLLGLLTGLAVGVGGGYLLVAASEIAFFLLWGGLLYGAAVGEVVLRVTGRKRGIKVEITSGVCAALGAAAGFALWWLVNVGDVGESGLFSFLAHNPFYLASVGLAVFSAVSRVRFF
jgi:hypothetical protein